MSSIFGSHPNGKRSDIDETADKVGESSTQTLPKEREGESPRRRNFLKFLGMGMVGSAGSFFGSKARAVTWHKIESSSAGGALTWRKLGPTVTSTIGFADVACGRYYSIALRSDGLVVGSGRNESGQLGNNSTTNCSTFVQAMGISRIVAIACGANHSVALRSDGLVYCAGDNSAGQLGDNTTINRSTFIPAVGLSNVVAIAGGYYRSMAIRADGLVFSVGYNHVGQLGDNSTATRSSFVQALGISNCVGVACGYFHSMALRADGFGYTCGLNQYGQLGDNIGITSRRTFAQTVGVSSICAIACGYHNSSALRSDGFVFSAGSNEYGQFGDNSSTATCVSYIQATGISDAIAIASSAGTIRTLRSDGLVFTCGQNNKGQLGINSITHRSTFVQAIGISGALGFANRWYHGLALCSDGVVFSCGYNSYGGLGDNTTTSRRTFVQVI